MTWLYHQQISTTGMGRTLANGYMLVAWYSRTVGLVCIIRKEAA